MYLSTGAFPKEGLIQTFERARSWGVKQLELGSGVPHHPDSVSLVKAAASDFDLLVHNYFPAPEAPFVLNLAALDSELLEMSLRHCRGCLQLTAEIGAPFYAAHAGFAHSPQPEDLGQKFSESGTVVRVDAYSVFVESVSALLDYARDLGVAFLIENNVCAPFNAPDGINDKMLLAEPDEIMNFCRDLGDPDFGLLMDVGHLKVSARTLGFSCDSAMQDLAPVIKAFHLSENDGSADTNDPFDQTAWFLPWVERLSDCTVTIEAYDLDQASYKACQDVVDAAQRRGALS